MSDKATSLKQLIESDKELQDLLKTYSELDYIYHEALVATGQAHKTETSVANTAVVTVSFKPSGSSADWSTL